VLLNAQEIGISSDTTESQQEELYKGRDIILVIISAICALAAVVSALFAVKSHRSAKKVVVNQTLLELGNDYRSPQMGYAIKQLWDYYRKYGEENFVREYEKIRKDEDNWVSSLDKNKRSQAVQNTLHFQRRLVSQFYQHLANLYVNKRLPKNAIYEKWLEADLRIIPKILVPIENKLRGVLHKPPVGPLDENCPLLVLYRDSKN